MSRASPAVWRPYPALLPPPTMRKTVPSALAARTRPASSSPRSASLEPVEVGKGQLPGVDVHGPELGAASQGRDGLAGIEQAGRIEGGLDGGEGLYLGLAELHAHLIDLFA